MVKKVSPLIKRTFQMSLIKKCHTILRLGYIDMKASGVLLREWDEDNISARLIDFMKNVKVTSQSAISINAQSPLYSEEITGGGVKAKKAPVIDFKFSSWRDTTEFVYYMEAKNLSESNWTKENKIKVSASYYYKRYVASGIDNFVSNRYSNGCIVAYCVHGNPVMIAQKINQTLCGMTPARNREILVEHPTFTEIISFKSTLPRDTDDEVLLHFFLPLN